MIDPAAFDRHMDLRDECLERQPADDVPEDHIGECEPWEQ